MKGRIFLLLFALPFFGVGAWMGYSIGADLAAAWQMKQWVPVQGTLLRGGYETHSGDDSNTYEANADYTYEFGGQQYTNDRVAIASGADNIGGYQQDMGRYFSDVLSRGESIVVYVNPDNPSEAVIDRSLRWGLTWEPQVAVVGEVEVEVGTSRRHRHSLPESSRMRGQQLPGNFLFSCSFPLCGFTQDK